MDMSLKAAIVEKSKDLSYAKSIEEFNTEELFVEADKDHVATQHNGNKMVKIVYVHEEKIFFYFPKVT